LHELYPRIDHEWKAHGVMEKLIVDNGLEFHSDSLEKACYAFGVEIEYTPRKTPWFKGKIERFNGTINRSLSHGTPGTTFSNIFEKDDYDPSKHAVVTLSTLREILHMWIADYYHQKPHRALDSLTPAAMWESSIRQTDISLANDPARIDVLLGKTITAKPLTHIGIEVNRLQYNSPELVSLRRQYGSELKVDIRVDEEDVGHLYVMLPDGSGFLEVPAIDKDYAQGVSLWLHNICRNYAKLHLEANNPLNWALAKSVIRDIVQEEMKFKRSKTNSRKGRYIDSEQRSQNSVAKLKRALPKPAPAKAEIVIDFQPSDPVTRPKFTTVIENRGKQS
jgi:putative transposase